VLIVDEPTNDLDIPTREVLEESLLEFPGALVLVTHDRFMLTRVCTQFLGLDGKGYGAMFAEYQQWEQWLGRHSQGRDEKNDSSCSPQIRTRRSSKKRLTFREQQEYDSLEAKILEAESAVQILQGKIEDPRVATDHVQLQETLDALNVAQGQVETLYERWCELEDKVHYAEE